MLTPAEIGIATRQGNWSTSAVLCCWKCMTPAWYSAA
jgi:hypothetical protein